MKSSRTMRSIGMMTEMAMDLLGVTTRIQSHGDGKVTLSETAMVVVQCRWRREVGGNVWR